MNSDELEHLDNLAAHEAIAFLQDLDEQGDTDATVNLGLLYIDLGQTGRAEECFKRALLVDLDAANYLGRLWCRTGRVNLARALYKDVFASAPAVVGLNYGTLVDDVDGDKALAEAIYRETIEAGEQLASVNLALLLEELGRDLEAEELLRDAAAMGVEGANRHLGIRLMKKGDTQGAGVVLQDAVAGGDSKALVELGNLSANDGDLEAAERYYRAAVAAGVPIGMLGLAQVLEERGQLDSARNMFLSAVEEGLDQAKDLFADFEDRNKTSRQDQGGDDPVSGP